MTAMESQAETNARLAAGRSSATQGTCVSVDWPNRLAKVNVGGVSLDMPMVQSAPFPGDPVWVAYLGAVPFCMGSIPKSSTATVVGSPAGGLVAVTADDGKTYTVPYNVGYTPASGHRVVLDWSSNGVIVARMSAEPAGVTPSVPPPPPAPGGGAGVQSFNAADSGTWRGGGWVDSLFGVSDSRSGFYWYGTQIRDTVPSGATVTGFGISIAADWAQLAQVTLTLHAYGSKTGAPPPPLDTFVVSSDGGYKQLPVAWGIAMKNGTAFGIGSVQGSGFLQWQSASTSGALSVSWA